MTLRPRPEERHRLELGPDIVQRLIPHRRPLVMLDKVLGFDPGERPMVWASRTISANEPVFEGHFPGLHLWPGIYTQEGLGQTTLVLEVLMALVERARERGLEDDAVCAAFRNLERGHRLHPGFDPDGSRLLETLAGPPPMGLSGSVQMRFVEPVFAGQTLDYVARRTQRLEGRLVRSEVEARVDGRLVAEGVLVGAVKAMSLPPAAAR